MVTVWYLLLVFSLNGRSVSSILVPEPSQAECARIEQWEKAQWQGQGLWSAQCIQGVK